MHVSGEPGRKYNHFLPEYLRPNRQLNFFLLHSENDSLTIKSSPENITHVFTGIMVTLRCEFDSKAPFTTWWGIKGLEGLPDYYRMRDYGSWLEIDDVGESDNNVYYCRASNGFKTVTAYTHLSVYSKWRTWLLSLINSLLSFYQIRSRECAKYATVLLWGTGQKYETTKWLYWTIQTLIFFSLF